MKRLALLAVLLALSACGNPEPESAANKADRVEREIGERANALNAQVENELALTEQRLEEEAEQALDSLNAAANSLDEAVPAAPAAAGQNKAR